MGGKTERQRRDTPPRFPSPLLLHPRPHSLPPSDGPILPFAGNMNGPSKSSSGRRWRRACHRRLKKENMLAGGMEMEMKMKSLRCTALN